MQPTAMTSSKPQISEPMMAAVMMDSCGVNKHYNGRPMEFYDFVMFCNLLCQILVTYNRTIAIHHHPVYHYHLKSYEATEMPANPWHSKRLLQPYKQLL
jgi:hypothetical protein